MTFLYSPDAADYYTLAILVGVVLPFTADRCSAALYRSLRRSHRKA